MSTLLVVSRSDTASMSLGHAICSSSDFDQKDSSLGDLIEFRSMDAFMITIDKIHLNSDFIGSLLEEEINHKFDDVIVLSRHYSESGRPAMTVHPIGVVTGVKLGEIGLSGGLFGTLVPPNPKMSWFLSEINRVGRVDPRLENFDLTIEATHHGPVMSLPTMYLEIGSTELQWSDPYLANIWSDLITKSLSSCFIDEKRRWILGIGGGHYAPRHRDIVIRSGEIIGHILPGYSLPKIDDDLQKEKFEIVLESAIQSMIASRPEADIIAHFDRKSMKSWQRKWLTERLAHYGIPVLRGKQILQNPEIDKGLFPHSRS